MCPYVPGSQTAQDPGEARINAPPNVAFRVVSGRRRPEVRGISRLDNLAHSSSCLRFVSGLTTVPARLGAGVACWALTVRLFHPLHLDGLCGAVYIVFLQVGWYCPQKNTVLTHRLLALRHVTPYRLLRSNLRLPRGNHQKTSG
jgi:hypothetical protein